jgi:hypothetical protein
MGQSARRKRYEEKLAAGYEPPPTPTSVEVREGRATALAHLRAQPLHGDGPGPRPATLDVLRQLVAEREALAADMAGVVRLGRAVGCTWAELGAAAGITRQAARERWHGLDSRHD